MTPTDQHREGLDLRIIGFVGLGLMGLPMSMRLLAEGFELRAYDADPAARERFREATGTETAPSLSALAEDVDAIILMLPTSKVVRHVLVDEGLLAAAREGTLFIDMGSSEPPETESLASLAATNFEVELIDAPVSGGVPGAQNGTLSIMVGGSDSQFSTSKPLLDSLGSHVDHIGGVGSGHALKALNNLMSATSLLISSEALAVGMAFGLQPGVMVDIINASTGRSWSTQVKIPEQVLNSRYSSGFSLQLMVKDLRNAMAIARATGIEVGLAERSVQLWEQAAEELGEKADHTSIAQWVFERLER